MRKVIFEGNINGKTFNSVQEYNVEMQRLMSSGALNIQASSKTRVVDKYNEQKKAVDEVVNTPKPLPVFMIDDYLPLFSEDAKQYYLDYLVSEDKAKNENNLKITNTKLQADLDNLKALIKDKKISLDDAVYYMRTIKEILSRLDMDAKANIEVEKGLQEEIAACNERLEVANRELNVTNNASPFIKSVSDFYKQAYDLTKGYVLGI